MLTFSEAHHSQPRPQTQKKGRNIKPSIYFLRLSGIIDLRMEAKLISGGARFTTLPMSYVRPEPERPLLSEVSPFEHVPIIDFGCVDRSRVVRQIGDACRLYGFFQVVNHGVSTEVVERMQEVAAEFFQLPIEEKMKFYSEDPTKTMRLSTSFNVTKEKVHNWRDYLRLHCHPLDKYTEEWPSNPPTFKYLSCPFSLFVDFEHNNL